MSSEALVARVLDPAPVERPTEVAAATPPASELAIEAPPIAASSALPAEAVAPMPAAAAPPPATLPQAAPQPSPGAVTRGSTPTTATPAPAAAQPVPAAPPEPACIGLRSLSAPAEVWLAGTRLGTTRDRGCARVPAGTHTFTLRGPMIREREVVVTLAPGEVLDPYVVTLERAPGRVRFSATLPATCVVLVDDATRGTLGALDYAVQLSPPDRPHDVVLSCQGQRQSVRYASLDYPEVWFASEKAP
jgi:hypothetical protein